MSRGEEPRYFDGRVRKVVEKLSTRDRSFGGAVERLSCGHMKTSFFRRSGGGNHTAYRLCWECVP